MKIAIVTGASSGMGKEFVLQLKDYVQVDEVWAIARRTEALEKLEQESGLKVRPISLDLCREESFRTVEQLLALQRADYGSKGADKQEDPFSETETLLRQILSETLCLGLKDLAVNGRDLGELGCPAGPQMGAILQHLLEQVGEEKLPNDRQALLSEARRCLEKQNT